MAEVKKGAACCWGVDVATTTDYGRVVGWRHTKGSALAELQDQDGDIATAIFHGIFEEGELEIVPDTTTYTAPEIGDALTIATTYGVDDASTGGLATKYYVTGCVANQTVGDAAKLTVSVKRYPDINT